MKILRLQAHNVKRISDIDLKLEGRHLFIIGGRNGSGKSSAIDALVYALGGARAIPAKPLKEGESEGSIRITLDGDTELHQTGVIVERTFKKRGKSELVVKSDDGFEAPTPQAILDSLLAPGRFGFDPLAFTRLKPREQLDQLRGVVGLNFSELDRDRLKAFDERSIVNRQVRDLQGRIKSMPHHEGLPDEVQSVGDLAEKFRRCESVNRDNDKLKAGLVEARQILWDMEERIVGWDENIKRIQAELDRAQQQRDLIIKRRDKFFDDVRVAESNVEKLEYEDTADIERQMNSVEQTNEHIRQNHQRLTLMEERETTEAHAELLSKEIERIDEEKRQRMAAADWPVPGLGYGEDGIILNGLPFEQASSAEQMRVSVAMGMKINPTLRVLIIRDGALLDNDNLAAISRQCEENDYQLLLEMATRDESEDQLCSVIIEEGRVKRAHVPA